LAFHSGREADHSPPSSVEVKEWVELHLQSPNTPSWCGAQLGGAQERLSLLPYNIWCSVQVMNLLIMQCSLAYHHFLPLNS
jgi:hypothetical protein